MGLVGQEETVLGRSRRLEGSRGGAWWRQSGFLGVPEPA